MIKFEHIDKNGEIINRGHVRGGGLFVYGGPVIASRDQWEEFKNIVDNAYEEESK